MLYTETVTVTTDGSGDGTGVTSKAYNGYVVAVSYAKTDYADTVDFDVEATTTGIVIWSEDNVTASKDVYPGIQGHTNAGVAATLDGTRPLLRPIPLVNETITVTVANGGATKTGAFTFIVESNI